MRLRLLSGIILFSMLVLSPGLPGCTNFLITRGASVDASVMVTYAADSHELYGELYFRPAAVYASGTMMDIVEWDTGKFLGRIPQAQRTYSVVGNMNEHQVVIGETTYGGRKELHNPEGIIDYGSLMYIALQRSRTAREAIKVMTDLVAEHGYCSSGESFSVADSREAWILEMIGKGPGRKGAVWVARRIPDGYVSAHANQARIRSFPLNDKTNCMYAPDVISFAREKGYFSGPDAEFSFADAYAPLDFGALRFCEARVWSMFRRVAPSQSFPLDYVMGKTPDAEPLPLWIRPDQKLSVKDVMALMRDHFEDSPMDLTTGIGAGPYHCPYRWRPLTWKLDGKSYFNERATATQQTGFSFVSQARANLPNPIGGILWFAVDDTNSCVYVPMYCGILDVPKAYAVGTADFDHFSWDSAFWVFNFVSNYCYLRYSDMIVDVKTEQQRLEGQFLSDVEQIDRAAKALLAESPRRAREYLTRYCLDAGNLTVARWRKLGETLIVKYLDGNVRNARGKVTHPGYPEAWYRRIVEERKDFFQVPERKEN